MSAGRRCAPRRREGNAEKALRLGDPTAARADRELESRGVDRTPAGPEVGRQLEEERRDDGLVEDINHLRLHELSVDELAVVVLFEVLPLLERVEPLRFGRGRHRVGKPSSPSHARRSTGRRGRLRAPLNQRSQFGDIPGVAAAADWVISRQSSVVRTRRERLSLLSFLSP